MHGPSPAPTTVWLVWGGQWTKSHARSDQQRVAGDDEEVLLVGLPVVHRHRLARPEHLDVDADLRPILVAFEVAERAPPLGVVPADVVCVGDEPALAPCHAPVLGLLLRSFGNHGCSLPQTVP
jgi:hypothetical protein